MAPTSSSVRKSSGLAERDGADRVRVGEVVEGFEHVKTIEGLGSASGTPKGKITIADSGAI